MRTRFIKWGGLGVLLLAYLWLSSTSAQAATVTVELCAKTGVLALPGGGSTPIWGFVNNSGGGCTGVATLPGPEIRVNEGDTVIINLTNDLATPTSIVIAGQSLTASGGVPGLLTQEAPPGGTVSYSFIAVSGVYLYESGTDFDVQLGMGLYGALVVDSAAAPYTGLEGEAVLVLSEIDPNLNANPTTFNMLNYQPRYFLINGQGYPDTPTLTINPGDDLLLRYVNASFDHYSMALLGAHQAVIARNGFVLPNSFLAVAETVPAGQTLDAIVTAPAAAAGSTLMLHNRNFYITNNGVGPGGMRLRLNVSGSPPPPVNQPPTAYAGPDQTITLPADAALNGNASDDGLPTPATLTIAWSQVSGPGVATFANPNALATNVSFSAAGVYSLRLTVSDGALATSDEVMIIANQAPTVSAGDDQTITLPATAALNGIVTDDGLPPPANLVTIWSQVSGPGTASFANANDVDTVVSFSAAGAYELRLTADDGAAQVSDELTVVVNAAASNLIYVSSTSGGTVGGVDFDDEDILVYDTDSGSWAMLLDLSDVGVAADVDAFAFADNGNRILVSFDVDIANFPGALGAVDDSDVLLFTPTTWGLTTAGPDFTLYFDGSDVGLTTSDEDVDALHLLPDGTLLISTLGSFSVPGAVAGNDEDLIRFSFSGAPGAVTTGTWQFYFDGSDVGLSAGQEDTWGVWTADVNQPIYLSTQGNFAVTGASGDDDDLFICTPGGLGSTSTCTFSFFWNGGSVGYGAEKLDGIALNDGPTLVSSATRNTGASATDGPAEEVQDDVDDSERADEEEQQRRFFLPLISR